MHQKIVGLINRTLIGLQPEDTVKRAMQVMNENKISCILVIQSGKAIGILTERGMVTILAKSNGRFVDSTLAEVMSAPVITVPNDTLIYEALHIFINKEIRHLVVVDGGGEAIGIITLSDIVLHIGSDIMIEFQDISRFMSRVIFTLNPDETLNRVLSEMANHAISCVIIADKEKPVGMITERDIVRLAAAGEDISQIRVADVMSSPVVQVQASSRVYKVTDIMRGNNIRRVVVVDGEGRISGLATQTNIMRGLESNYIKILKQVITEQDNRIERTNRELSDLSQYLVTILNSSIDMAIVATDQDFRIIYFNSCAETILGYSSREAIGKRVQEIHLHFAVESDRFAKIIDEVRRKGTHTFSFERERNLETLHYQGRISPIHSPSGTDFLGYVFMVQDVTAQKRAEENMRYMAYHDILTGLPNRVAFTERLELELARAKRNSQRLAIIVIDINRFKEVNDTYGHFTGDILLKAVAGRLGGAIRKSDTVARVGGDEFMIILAELTNDNDAIVVTHKLIETLMTPVDLKDVSYHATISIGMTFFPEHGDTARILCEKADQAMYQAKEVGHSNGQSNMKIFGSPTSYSG